MPPMHLSRTDWEVLESLLPAGGHPTLPLGISDTGFELFLDEFQGTAPPHFRRAFRIGLFAAAWIAPLLVRRLPPFRRLNDADRNRALAAMGSSRVPELRQLVSVLKSVVSLHYGALAPVRKAIGYP